jgi:hypothetical protein
MIKLNYSKHATTKFYSYQSGVPLAHPFHGDKALAQHPAELVLAAKGRIALENFAPPARIAHAEQGVVAEKCVDER